MRGERLYERDKGVVVEEGREEREEGEELRRGNGIVMGSEAEDISEKR